MRGNLSTEFSDLNGQMTSQVNFLRKVVNPSQVENL